MSEKSGTFADKNNVLISNMVRIMKSTRNFMFVFALILNLWTIKANAMEYLCNRWNVLMDSGFELGPVYGEIWTNGYKLQGDTIINSTHYSRLLFADGYHQQQNENWEWVYYGALKETANAEIYFIPAGQNKEYLLFAFNVKVGDQIDNLYRMNNNYNVWAMVKEVSDKEIILDLYEQLDESSDIFMHDYVWIKGVGAKHSMFQPLPNGGVGGCVVNFLLCAYNDEKHIYTSEMGQKYGCKYWRETAAFENLSAVSSPATKLLRDGQLFIERDGKTFNAIGQIVQ